MWFDHFQSDFNLVHTCISTLSSAHIWLHLFRFRLQPMPWSLLSLIPWMTIYIGPVTLFLGYMWSMCLLPFCFVRFASYDFSSDLFSCNEFMLIQYLHLYSWVPHFEFVQGSLYKLLIHHAMLILSWIRGMVMKSDCGDVSILYLISSLMD